MSEAVSRHGLTGLHPAEDMTISSDLLSPSVSQERDNWLTEETEPDVSADAEINPIGDSATGTRRRRRMRSPKSLGRFPFLIEYRSYLEHIEPFYQGSTFKRIAKNLSVIGRDIQSLRDQGLITTSNPAKLTQDDIGQLILFWKTRPSRYVRSLDPATQARYLSDLAGLMEYHGNGTIAALKRQKKLRLPRAVQKPITVLSQAELARLRQAAQGMDGWWGKVATFLVAFLAGTGLRRKEVRLARIEDLDIEHWRIMVAHPKGEGSWAAPADAWIAPEARQATLDFLEDRQELLGGRQCEALVPYKYEDGTLGYWSDAMLGKLKGELEARSGVRFHLKTLRATFAQMAKDKGASIEAVSKALRHKNTVTTERFYAQIRTEDAFQELEEAFLVQKRISVD